jgi:hypothetical protein
VVFLEELLRNLEGPSGPIRLTSEQYQAIQAAAVEALRVHNQGVPAQDRLRFAGVDLALEVTDDGVIVPWVLEVNARAGGLLFGTQIAFSDEPEHPIQVTGGLLTEAFWQSLQQAKTPASLSSKHFEVPIPVGIDPEKKIGRVVLVSDVDGVVRKKVLEGVEPRVVGPYASLAQTGKASITFISGSPVQSRATEPWRQDNAPLGPSFHQAFGAWPEGVRLFGAMGGQLYQPETSGIYLNEPYTFEQQYEASRLLIQTFLELVRSQGNDEQQRAAVELLADIPPALSVEDARRRNIPDQLTQTPLDFAGVMEGIRSRIDPHTRLIWRGSMGSA